MPVSIDEITSLKEFYTAAGQGHVFTFFDDLSTEKQQLFVAQLKDIDPSFINRVYEKVTADEKVTQEQNEIKPFPAERSGSILTANKETIDDWETTGLKAIAQNQVAVILMAGGQGTRLGSSAPKGCYDINHPSHKSLFQLQAERIIRLQSLAQQYTEDESSEVIIPWYIMTSGPTHTATIEHFEQHDYFGLKKSNVVFFNQGIMPCVSYDGKILLETKSKLAIAPNGNGGIYDALRRDGILDDLATRGIRFIHSYCVDNCLVKVADPMFMGYCISKEADCGNKVVRKAYPTEPIGVVSLRNGKPKVVEYSEIDPSMAELTDQEGQLVYKAGNIANHFYTLDFLQRVKTFEDKLDYHVAKKKIKHVDLTTGEKIVPSSPNGIKFEVFVFDVFPFTENLAVFEVDRKEEFSPLKNAPGSGVDCPETSLRDITQQGLRFLQNSGAIVENIQEDVIPVEISPLVSYNGEGLETLAGKVLSAPVYINSLEDLSRL
ncbi:UDP-N-acetylglucosamine pyrophosphorylase [Basidiobolus ranarum]|uniref:UDP-N-acetylglucosamine diphosphorylase n=1 Tax=Basidiobolus ranarum TaxID=34480 RepID=A0ABR2WNY9_9FUNG